MKTKHTPRPWHATRETIEPNTSIYPTHKAVAYTTARTRQGAPTRRKLGARLIPNGFTVERAGAAILRKYPTADAMRLYDQAGAIVCAGCLP